MRRIWMLATCLVMAAGQAVGQEPEVGRHTVHGPVAVSWATLQKGAHLDGQGANATAVSSDGSKVIVTGTGWSGGVVHETVAYDATTGDQLWLVIEGGGSAVSASPSGGIVFVCGSGPTVAYDDLTGGPLWTSEETGRDLVASPDGLGVYLARGDATLAFDAQTGTMLWQSPFGGDHLAASPDGRTVYAARGSGLCYLVRALDATSGELVWGHDYCQSKMLLDATGIDVSPDGSKVFVTGGEVSPRLFVASDYVTLALDATAAGERLWVRNYDQGLGDKAESVVVRGDGRIVYVSGSSRALGGIVFVTIAYDVVTGEIAWESPFQTRLDNPTDWAVAMDVSEDGYRVYVTGATWWGQANRSDYATVAYDGESGAQVWHAFYDGPDTYFDSGTDLATGPDNGTVFVTGFTGQCMGEGCGQLASPNVTVAYREILQITLDIKPDDLVNSVNPRSRGVIPVAILGSDTFEVSDIDVPTLAFGLDRAPTAYSKAHSSDVDEDGILDLVVHFRTQATGIACGDETVTLTGKTNDGQDFEGSDSIRTVACRASERPVVRALETRRFGDDTGQGQVRIQRN